VRRLADLRSQFGGEMYFLEHFLTGVGIGLMGCLEDGQIRAGNQFAQRRTIAGIAADGDGFAVISRPVTQSRNSVHDPTSRRSPAVDHLERGDVHPGQFENIPRESFP